MNEKSVDGETGSRKDMKQRGGFLWKINYRETEMYVFGTIHLGDNRFYPLAPCVEDAFNQANVVMPEIYSNTTSMDQETLMKLALFKDDHTLDQMVRAELYQKLSAIFRQNGLDMEEFRKFQPWFIDLMLLNFATALSKVDSDKSVDGYLINKAEKTGKSIVPLESEDMQSKVFSSFGLETQVQVLQRTIQRYEQLPNETEQSAENWLNRDIRSFQQVRTEFETSGIHPEYFEKINDQRNRSMCKKLDQTLQSNRAQTYFVFVGAFHVLLEPSLPTLLANSGYQVERIL